MDKKEAETEALRRAKETQHAAGKITGMSGRDLVSLDLCFDGFVTWLQFQYNPEWFEDEDEGDGSDDFDLTMYRRNEEEVYAELRQTEQGVSDLHLYEDDEDSKGGGSAGDE